METSISSKLDIPGNWKTCQYKIAVGIYFDTGYRDLNSVQIAGLLLEKNYDKLHLPIMLLDLVLGEEDTNAIGPGTRFNIRITQYYKEDSDSEKSEGKTYLSGTFIQMNIEDRASTKQRLIKKKKRLSDSEKKVDPEELTKQTTYVLLKESDLDMSKKMVNEVMTGVDMYDTVMFLLSKYGNSKLMISNFTNMATHDELLLKPNQLLKTLIELEAEYGWHKEGTYLFLDFGMLYIVRKNAECTVWVHGEPKVICFCINDVASSDNIPRGVKKTTKKVYYNIGRNQCDFSNSTKVGDHIDGGNAFVVDESSGTMKTFNGIGKNASLKSYRGNNPYVAIQYKRNKREENNQVTLTCINGDLSYLTPNKQYVFLTDVADLIKSKRLDGDYRLSSIRTSFAKNGPWFDTVSEINVKCVKRLLED